MAWRTQDTSSDCDTVIRYTTQQLVTTDTVKRDTVQEDRLAQEE